jgi:hypothetical protein
MPEMLTALVVMVTGTGLIAGLYLLEQSMQSRKREAFQALAARRGWSLTISEQKLGRPPVLRLSARSGLGWQVEVRRNLTGPRAGAAVQMTEFHSEGKEWPDGLLLIGPPSPEAGAESNPLQELDNPQGRRILARVLGDDLAKYATVLTHYPALPAITVFATASPTPRFDLGDLAKAMGGWKPRMAGERGRPVVMFGPDGLRLRLRHGTHRADHMEEFIDFALEIARKL